MSDRQARVERKTAETEIAVRIDLDGTGRSAIQTPLPFLSHMLDQIARHGLFDLDVEARGDVEIDGHHTTEDLGITLGAAVLAALGDKKGIARYGEATLPMDEALVTCALDLSGRPFFVSRVPLPKAKLGTWDVELCPIFFEGFARGAQCNLHLRLLEGDNLHHIVEILLQGLHQGADARDPASTLGRSPCCPRPRGLCDAGRPRRPGHGQPPLRRARARRRAPPTRASPAPSSARPTPTSSAAPTRSSSPARVPSATARPASRAAMGDALRERIAAGVPFLGICLGLQALFEGSDEAPGAPGLGVFAGRVERLGSGEGYKIPHMGWNRVTLLDAGKGPLAVFAGEAPYFYFVHSFHAVPADPALLAAVTEHGPHRVTAAVQRDNVTATQFHPEKSQAAGLRLLAAFLHGLTRVADLGRPENPRAPGLP